MNTIISGFFTLIFLMLSGCAIAEPHCEDFLSKLSKKPESVEYLSCVQENDTQGKPFVARYRVKGSSALEAEKYMTQSFGLPKLKFICCGWDSTPFFYRDKKTNLGYMLGMGSEETPVNEREYWSEISFFYITVYFSTEEA